MRLNAENLTLYVQENVCCKAIFFCYQPTASYCKIYRF
jgi:hypothetical protein